MPLDFTCGTLAAGLACYGRGEFYAAHEHWEHAWLAMGKLSTPEKLYLQALIQLTSARHHLLRGNLAGAASLLAKAQSGLEKEAPALTGANAARFLCDADAMQRELQARREQP